MKTRTHFVIPALAVLALSACGGGGEPFDQSRSALDQPLTVATMDITSVSSSGEEMVGTIWAYINFTSEFHVSSDAGVVCEGNTNAHGVGAMNCSDGRMYPIAIEGYGSFNGSYVEEYPGETVQITWNRRT